MTAIVRDRERGRWRRFGRPCRIVSAIRREDVRARIAEMEGAVAAGLHAVGFIAYEAAPAFDPALEVKEDGAFPLVWFALHERFDELAELPPAEEILQEAAWSPSIDRDTYRAAVGAILERILEGDTYQVNYTYRLRTATVSSPRDLFVRLAAAQRSDYAAYIETDDWIVCSASPELFFEKRGRGILSRPMKGTAPRGLWYEDDCDRATRLRESSKERAENVMIVDMVRNDLGRIAATGSVRVDRLFDVERYPTVWQMTSTVSARTDAGMGAVLEAMFPAASITGAPKASTMRIIASVECSPRRIYTGAIGFLDPDGRAQFSVAIRTVLVNRSTGEAEFGVGGGIVADSTWAREYEEAAVKAAVLRHRPAAFELLETLLWTPEEGCRLLERHLRRLSRSAEYFGFDLDPQRVRRALERAAAVLGGTGAAHRIRLLASRAGAVEVTMEVSPPGSRAFGPIALATEPIDSHDPFLYHKTTHREVYARALAACRGLQAGNAAADVLLFNERREITETTIASVLLEVGGRLVTPPVACGLLPGTARAALLDEGRVTERVVTLDELAGVERIYLVNAVRGLQPVSITKLNARPTGSSIQG